MQQKEITLTGVENKKFDNATKYTLKTDSGNYNFYDTKQDGGFTKAYTQFQELRPMIGDKLTVMFKEEQKSYEGKPYTDRKIMFFVVPQKGSQAASGVYPPTPAQYAPQNAPQRATEHSVAQRAFIAELVERVKKLEAEQDRLHKRLSHLEDKDKPDYVPLTEEAKKTEVDISEIPY